MSEIENSKALTEESQAIWNKKAEYWDNMMSGDGNIFHSLLVRPSVERLLQVQPGELILDVACGNGVFSRQLARLGAQVVATDFSARFIELARQNPSQETRQIEYRQVDATSEEQLLALGEKRFDAAVCTMAMQDIPTIEPLIQALSRLIKPSGRFVFAIPHPSFNSSAIKMGVEEEDRAGELVETYYLKVTDYLTSRVEKGVGAIGEPAPHYYFHRPLHLILNTCFQAGFVMDGLEEPAFNPQTPPSRPLSWGRYKTIPPVLAVRLRLLAK